VTRLLLLALLARPTPAITPGAAWPLTTAQVCTTKWGLDQRHVSRALRQRVFAAYGLRWTSRARFVVDHLVPRQLGGVDAAPNLWPQTIAAAHLKDVLENRLHRLVCAQQLPLTVAQRAIAHDWVQALAQYGGTR
jgi:hypothetical protein